MKRSRILLVALLLLAGGSAIFVALRGDDPVPSAAIEPSGGSARVGPPSRRTPVPAERDQPDPSTGPSSGIAITVEGVAIQALDPEALAQRPARLQARGRHAWPLGEILGDAYGAKSMHVRVHTADGRDLPLRGDGQNGDDVILVQRDDGSLYIGWLVPGAEQYGDALGDAERPAERIEDVVSLSISRPPPVIEQMGATPAELAIERDGKVVTMTASSFAAAATITFDHGGTAMRAIDLERGLGAPAQLVSLVAGGRNIDGAPPAPGARPVLFMNRRNRFKFTWIDAAGQQVTGGEFREVTQVMLRNR